jgi:hypothetical protein
MKKIIIAISTLFLLFLLSGCGPALYQAAGRGDVNAVRTLLDQGVKVNETYAGFTPLMNGVESGNIEVVRMLLDGGADVNAMIPAGTTSLNLAALRGHLGIAKLLMERGADIDKAVWGARRLGWGDAVQVLQQFKEEKDFRARNIQGPAQEEKPAYGKTESPRQPPTPPAVEPAAAKDLPKIAVWDLASRNTPVTYAQELTSILVSEVSKLGRYEVYSQENVRTLAGWTAERMSLGCTDTKCLTALGQMDVTKLISGSVGKIGDTYSISLNLFDTQKVKAEKSVSEFCRSENELIGLLQQGVRKLLSPAP